MTERMEQLWQWTFNQNYRVLLGNGEKLHEDGTPYNIFLQERMVGKNAHLPKMLLTEDDLEYLRSRGVEI